MFSCLDAAQQSQLARMLSSAQGRLSLLCEPPFDPRLKKMIFS